MYADESLTEVTEILFECECGYVSGETWEECPRCGIKILPDNPEKNEEDR